jgi:hypothetical protein
VLDRLTLVGTDLATTDRAILLVERIVEIVGRENESREKAVESIENEVSEHSDLSKQDQLILKLVTPEAIRVVGNPGLIRDCLNMLKRRRELAKLTDNGLRSALNRIRHAGGFPTSADLRKR